MNLPMHEREVVLTVAEAARLARTSQGWIRAEVHAGRLYAFTVGNRIKVPRSALMTRLGISE